MRMPSGLELELRPAPASPRRCYAPGAATGRSADRCPAVLQAQTAAAVIGGSAVKPRGGTRFGNDLPMMALVAFLRLACRGLRLLLTEDRVARPARKAQRRAMSMPRSPYCSAPPMRWPTRRPHSNGRCQARGGDVTLGMGRRMIDLFLIVVGVRPTEPRSLGVPFLGSHA